MKAQNAIAGLLRGTLSKFLKDALVYLKNPQKLSQLLAAVIVYTRKNKNAVKSFLKDILFLWEMLNAWFRGEYKEIPKKTIVLIVTALLYFIGTS